MEDDQEEILLRSEQVQEILEATPNRWMLYGNTLILLVTLVLFAISCFVKYPKTISVPLAVKRSNAPSEQISNVTGRIVKLFKTEGSTVTRGTPLAIMESDADYQVVSRLETYLYDPVKNKEEIQNINTDKLGILKDDVLLVKSLFWSLPDNAQIKREQLNLLFTYVDRLNRSIKAWKKQYVITASVDGMLSNFFYSADQQFEKGDILFSITPIDSVDEVLTIKIPDEYGDSFAVGQRIDMKVIDSDLEIRGTIVKKHADFSSNTWVLYLESSLEKTRSFPPNTSAMIVVEDSRLIHQFLTFLDKV